MSFTAVTLEVTKKCNHECAFCYNIADEGSPDVTFEQIDIVVSKLKKYGIENVTVTGGEPYMVRAKTEYLISQLLREGLDVCLNTNLTLLDDKGATFLESTIGHDNIVYSSIPSVDRDTCDSITKRPGSYDRILNGLAICRRHSIKVGLNMTVSSLNIANLGKIPEFLEQNPVDSFTLFPVIPPVYDRDNPVMTNEAQDLVKVADMLCLVHERFGITVGSIRPLPRCIIGDNPRYDVIIGSRCTTGSERFAIDLSTGEMEACSQENRKYGNIYQDSIEDCFKGTESWRRNEKLAPVCRECTKLDKCGGMCLWSDPCGRC